MTTFHVKDSFYLTGRGLFAMGEILSGRIRTGDLIKLEINNKPYSITIKSVEMGHKSNGDSFVGLILENISVIDLKSVKLNPQIVEVINSSPK